MNRKLAGLCFWIIEYMTTISRDPDQIGYYESRCGASTMAKEGTARNPGRVVEQLGLRDNYYSRSPHTPLALLAGIFALTKPADKQVRLLVVHLKCIVDDSVSNETRIRALLSLGTSHGWMASLFMEMEIMGEMLLMVLCCKNMVFFGRANCSAEPNGAWIYIYIYT